MSAEGCKVGVPVYSCAALRNAVGMIGAECVYIDCANQSPNVNLEQANKYNIDFLIAPSMFGIPIDIPKITKYRVIEDLAQSFGAKIRGERIGLRGELGICSFYATKMITSAGQGGAVISRNKSLIDSIKDYRQFDCREDSRLRFNFQMTDLQAAVGRVQLSRLNSFIEQREEIFSIYSEAGLDLIEGENGAVRYRAVIRTNEQKKIISILESNGIKVIIPIEQKELLSDPSQYKEAQKLSLTTVSLPIYPALQYESAKHIANLITNNI